MSLIRVRLFFFGLLAIFFANAIGVSQERSLPEKLTAAILVKLLEYEVTLVGKSEVRIHVLDNFKLAKSLESHIGTVIAGTRLSSVTYGSDIPDERVDVLFITKKGNIPRCLEYTRRHGSLSVTNDNKLMKEGVSIGIFDDEGMPGILLNSESSRKEKVVWRPEILSVAKVYKK